MAGPTVTTDNNPKSATIVVSSTNVTTASDDVVLGYFSHGLHKGFSILTGTITNTSVTVLGYNVDSTKAVDITNDIFGASALVSNKGYACDVALPYATVIIRSAKSNATNANYLEIFCPKR